MFEKARLTVTVTLFVLITLLNVQGQQLTQKTFRKKFMEAVKKCSTEYSVPGGISLTYFISADKNSKCFTMCLLDQFNLMDRRGQYHVGSMKPFLNSIPKSRFKAAIESNLDSCLKESNQKDPCEKAYIFTQCFYKKASFDPANESGQRSYKP